MNSTGSGKYSFTIHPGIVEFKGDWYIFLHNAALAVGEMNGAIGRRAVTVERLHYNADGSLRPVVRDPGWSLGAAISRSAGASRSYFASLPNNWSATPAARTCGRRRPGPRSP